MVVESLAVIPARGGSTRLPLKPLIDLHGRPMVWWVYDAVVRSGAFEQAVVATDSPQILEACGRLGVAATLTSSQHGTSTERVREVASHVSANRYVCINGDEPLVRASHLRAIAAESSDPVVNLVSRFQSKEELYDPSNIKVVCSPDGIALYYSRAVIPAEKSVDASTGLHLKHLGLLSYTREALEFFCHAPRGPLESAEDINELRFLENGWRLRVRVVSPGSLSVDTLADAEEVRRRMANEPRGSSQ